VHVENGKLGGGAEKLGGVHKMENWGVGTKWKTGGGRKHTSHTWNTVSGQGPSGGSMSQRRPGG